MTKDKDQTSRGGYCPSCGGAVGADDRYCRHCGAPLSGNVRANGSPSKLLGLRAFGLAIVALATFYVVLRLGERPSGTAMPTQRISITDVAAGAASPAAPTDPRTAADMLFNEAMSAYEMGDSASARRFIPMALAAYSELADLDLDGRYHVALLYLAGGRPEDALSQAETLLAAVPDHLFGLSVSAEAYEQMGRVDDAVARYRRFLEVYSPEVAASRPEYIDHSRALPGRLEAARRYLKAHVSGSGGSAR
jgi:tetratricopeptide (TPR) repeat protein